MANDFSGDPRCKALWRLESGALTADSKGTNTLTDVNTVQEDLVDFKEGACAALFARANSEYLEITDANLDAGFPLKNGDTTKKITITGWFKSTGIPGYLEWHDIVVKWDWTGYKICFAFQLSDSYLQLSWGHTSDRQNQYWNVMTPTAGRWFHYGLVIDGVAKTAHIRLWDATAESVTNYNHTFDYELRICDAPFGIAGNSSTGDLYDGRQDEIVVFNNLLSDTEIDAIRNGVFPIPQYVSPTGITSAEAFGTAVVTCGAVTVEPTGIASSEAFGTPNVVKYVSPTGIPSAEDVGTPTITLDTAILQPSGIPSAEAFGTAVIQPGPVTVEPVGIASQEALGTPLLTLKIVPTGIPSEEAVGDPEVTQGTATITPTGVSSQEAFGTAVVQPGPAEVAPTGIPSGESVGEPKITFFVLPTGIATEEALGTPEVIPGPVTISPSGITSAEALGTPKFTLYIVPVGIASEEEFGTTQINQVIHPAGIPSAEAFGTLQVNQNIKSAGIPSAEAFGTAKLTLWLLPTGIPSEEAVGVPQVNYIIRPTGIPSAEAVGTPVISVGMLIISPFGIGSATVFGRAVILSRELTGLIVLEFAGLPALELTDGPEEIELVLDSPLRMVVNG